MESRDEAHDVERFINFIGLGPEIWFVSEMLQTSNWNNGRTICCEIIAFWNEEQENF